jgi:hypothetical protein
MKKPIAAVLALALFSPAIALAQNPAPAAPVRKITPGKVIVPTERMRRIWGELVSLDFENRTGKFRNESNDEVLSFTIMPYAELLHHAANGDLSDFRVGERAIFRLHENDQGEWVWLTYIQDEMNMLNGHKEFFHVTAIDAAKGTLTTTWANADKSFVRQEGVVIETDSETRYWKDGTPAKFADIQIGDKLRTKTHGRGSGNSRVAWEVFLDEASLLKFQAEQKEVHARRMSEEGLPGYVDVSAAGTVEVTLFREGSDARKGLKAGQAVRIAPAGADRKPTTEPVAGTVAKLEGDRAIITVPAATNSAFQPTGLARVWIAN